MSFKNDRMGNSVKCRGGVSEVRIERDRGAHSCNGILHEQFLCITVQLRSQGMWIKEVRSEDSDFIQDV